MVKGQTLKERILEKIEKNKNDCWIWKGAVFKKKYGNYGQIRIGTKNHNNLLRAHRVSYEIFIGNIPRGMELDHLCKNTLCVNPNHLEPVFHSENMARGKNATKEYCKNGHKYIIETTYLNPKGSRECRICRNDRR